jgi:hypothetical protein
LQYPNNWEQLTIKLILENNELRALREDSIRQQMKIEAMNNKFKLKEIRKAMQEAPAEEKTKEEAF